MIKHQAGLHKDVAKIFEGVWIPEQDNIQVAVSIGYKDSGVFVHPKPLATNQSPQRAKTRKQRLSRREKRRLSEISKQLLINMPK